jgi:plasmid stabilization system protein ParE
MAEIRWTEEAHRWLRDIYDYIAADNPDAAQTVVSGIYEKAQVLGRFPEIGHKYRSEAEGEIRGIPGHHIDFCGSPVSL